MANTQFQTNASVWIVVYEGENTTITEWAGPLPAKENRLRVIDGGDTKHLVVLNVVYAVTLTGDYGESGIMAPSEIYIHARPWIADSDAIDEDSEPHEFVSADRHPSLAPDPDA